MPHHVQIHKHRRKRVQKKLKPYPHSDKRIKNIDKVVDIISVVFPFTVIPQIYEIWVKKNTAGISLIT